MTMWFYFFIGLIIISRIIELIISKRNEKWLRNNGAIEYGREHYKYFILLHTFFFVSLLTEYNLIQNPGVNFYALLIFFVAQFFRLSVLISLGKYWNTRILVIPDVRLVRTGLYKYFKHPNYGIVIIEIIVIPLSFSLYYTLILFSLLNLILLSVRIKAENSALKY